MLKDHVLPAQKATKEKLKNFYKLMGGMVSFWAVTGLHRQAAAKEAPAQATVSPVLVQADGADYAWPRTRRVNRPVLTPETRSRFDNVAEIARTKDMTQNQKAAYLLQRERVMRRLQEKRQAYMARKILERQDMLMQQKISLRVQARLIDSQPFLNRQTREKQPQHFIPIRPYVFERKIKGRNHVFVAYVKEKERSR